MLSSKLNQPVACGGRLGPAAASPAADKSPMVGSCCAHISIHLSGVAEISGTGWVVPLGGCLVWSWVVSDATPACCCPVGWPLWKEPSGWDVGFGLGNLGWYPAAAGIWEGELAL